MSSSQHVLGLPIGLLDMGFHLLTFWTLLSLTMCSTWPNQFNLNSLIMNGYCSHISFLLLNTKLLFFKFCVIYLYDDDVLGSVVRSQWFILARMRWGIAVLICLKNGHKQPEDILDLSPWYSCLSNISPVLSVIRIVLNSVFIHYRRQIHSPFIFLNVKICMFNQRKEARRSYRPFCQVTDFFASQTQESIKKIQIWKIYLS